MTAFNSETLVHLSRDFPQVHAKIHDEYARKVGLLSHEFVMYTDVNLQHAGTPVDVVYQAGNAIHICVRQAFDSRGRSTFKSWLEYKIFIPENKKFFRELIRLPSTLELNKRLGTLVLRASVFSDKDAVVPRQLKDGLELRSYQTIVLRDKRTKREEHVQVVNGNYFEAQRLAEIALYGKEI
jgi:hypothetical protein